MAASAGAAPDCTSGNRTRTDIRFEREGGGGGAAGYNQLVEHDKERYVLVPPTPDIMLAYG